MSVVLILFGIIAIAAVSIAIITVNHVLEEKRKNNELEREKEKRKDKRVDEMLEE